jgi:hypothetical protein
MKNVGTLNARDLGRSGHVTDRARYEHLSYLNTLTYIDGLASIEHMQTFSGAQVTYLADMHGVEIEIPSNTGWMAEKE